MERIKLVLQGSTAFVYIGRNVLLIFFAEDSSTVADPLEKMVPVTAILLPSMSHICHVSVSN